MEHIWKLGGKILPPPKIVSLLDSKFDVDYYFAIKHVSIESDDWVCIFVSCPDRVEPPSFAPSELEKDDAKHLLSTVGNVCSMRRPPLCTWSDSEDWPCLVEVLFGACWEEASAVVSIIDNNLRSSACGLRQDTAPKLLDTCWSQFRLSITRPTYFVNTLWLSLDQQRPWPWPTPRLFFAPLTNTRPKN